MQSDRESLKNEYLEEWKRECAKLEKRIPELPFSNVWIAQHTAPLLPDNSILHLGIYNSLRVWSFFETKETVLGYSNTGGFGIDGCLSSAAGASIASDRLVYIVLGDLAFFYDVNVLGNRHMGNNLRILLINNGCGQEFKNPDNRAYQLGEAANDYISAWGHNAKKSEDLVKHFAQDLGFLYVCANNKKEYLQNLEFFLAPQMMDKPILFEAFTESKQETEALENIYNLEKSFGKNLKEETRKILGEKCVNKVKKLLENEL